MPTWTEILTLWNALKNNVLGLWGGILGIVFTAIWIFWENAPMKRVFLTFFILICFMSLVLVWLDEHHARKKDQSLYEKQAKELDKLTSIIDRKENEAKEFREEMKKKERRIVELIQKLPPPEIKREQQAVLEEALRRIDGPKRILIRYLDIPTARAIVFAQQLTKIFESASWRVRLISAKTDVIEKGVAIRRESGTQSTPDVEKAIIEAFSRAGLPIGTIIRGDGFLNEIEIEIGEM